MIFVGKKEKLSSSIFIEDKISVMATKKVKHIIKECLQMKDMSVLDNLKVLTKQDIQNNKCNSYTFAL